MRLASLWNRVEAYPVRFPLSHRANWFRGPPAGEMSWSTDEPDPWCEAMNAPTRSERSMFRTAKQNREPSPRHRRCGCHSARPWERFDPGDNCYLRLEECDCQMSHEIRRT